MKNRFYLLLALSPSLSAWAAVPNPLPDACDYVQQLSDSFATTGIQPTFQLLTSYAVDGAKSQATYNLKMLPHVVWGMGQLSMNVDQVMRKPIDMPSLDGFMKLAQKEHTDGELSSVKYDYLVFMNGLGISAALRSARAGAVQDAIEKSYPGVIKGNAGAFVTSKTFTDFLQATGRDSSTFTTADWQAFQVWTKPLPLYITNFTQNRADDIGITLGLIDHAATTKDLSLTEQACAWQLRERFLAEMISFTGTKGAPKITADGHLDATLWKNETPRGEAVYPTVDVPNASNQFVDNDWVTSRLDGSVDLKTEFTQTQELLAFLSYSANLIALRDAALWQPDAASTTATFALPIDLLKLGFGTLGVNLKNFSANHLTVLPGGRIQLRDNSNENLVSVAWSALNLSRSLLSLKNPNEIERAALTANQINDLIGATGAQPQLYQLFTGTVVEALNRRRASKYEIEILYQFLVQAGGVLDNDYLKNLPRLPTAPATQSN